VSADTSPYEAAPSMDPRNGTSAKIDKVTKVPWLLSSHVACMDGFQKCKI
jgi:hypothetical protein